MPLIFFLLQKDEETVYDIELLTLKQIIKNKHLFQFEEISINDLDKITQEYISAIPVGTIQFVEKFLLFMHGIKKMNPIEVPICLRNERFLKRNYEIIPGDEVPLNGYFFIKNASKLKDFTYVGNLENLPRNDHNPNVLSIDSNYLYVVSEPKNILSEYRIIVHYDEIKACQYYDGNPLIFPSEKDVALIKEMVLRWSLDKSRPNAYALDVAIILNNNQKEIMVLEACPFTSLGTYGFESQSLPYMYRDGFDWYLKHNNEPQIFQNKKELQ